MNDTAYADGITVDSPEEAIKHFKHATRPQHESGRIVFQMFGKDVELLWSTDAGELPLPAAPLNFEARANSLENAFEILNAQLGAPRTAGRSTGCISFNVWIASGTICWDIEWKDPS